MKLKKQREPGADRLKKTVPGPTEKSVPGPTEKLDAAADTGPETAAATEEFAGPESGFRESPVSGSALVSDKKNTCKTPFARRLKGWLFTHRRQFVMAGAFFVLSLLLIFLGRHVDGFGPAYNRYVYPLLPGTLGRILSPLPFSLFEALICLAILLTGGFLLFAVFALWRRGGRRILLRITGRAVPVVLCVISAMFLTQTLTCFLNYGRMDFSEEIGLAVYPASDEELKELCGLLIDDLYAVIEESGYERGSAGQLAQSESAQDAPGSDESSASLRDKMIHPKTGGATSAQSGSNAVSAGSLSTGSALAGSLSTDSALANSVSAGSVSSGSALAGSISANSLPAGAPLHFSQDGTLLLDNIDVRREARAAMEKLGATYPSLSGFYPNPKPIFFSRAMSTVSLTGIFSPYTTEANYNRDVTPYVIPYTICHELAHVKGFIKENEAGFISYLACLGADSPQLRYSGALNALSYSLNALYQNVTPEEYQAVLRTVPAQALADLQANQTYWQQFRKGVRGAISQTARAANDSYLRANAQSDGAKSYGRMVDLLLAYYKIGAEGI